MQKQPFWCVTEKSQRRYGAALWAGFWGGNVASFVKWGTEATFPPRVSGRAIPPAEMLTDWGFTVQNMAYTFSEHVLNWGISGVHHLFSIAFALFYCTVAEIFPAIKLWQGLAFGLLLTLMFHGALLPIFGWAPPIWELPFDELLSETFGHAIWIWTIEVFRRDLRNRWTKAPDAEMVG